MIAANDETPWRYSRVLLNRHPVLLGGLFVLTELSWAGGAADSTVPVIVGQALRVAGVITMLGVSMPVFKGPDNARLDLRLAVPVVVYGLAAAVRGLGSDFPARALWESVEFLAIWLVVGAALKLGSQTSVRLFGGAVGTYAAVSIWVGLQALLVDGAVREVGGRIPIQIQGVWPIVNPNQVGVMAGVGLIATLLFLESPTRRRTTGLLVVFFSLALLFSQSRTTWTILLILSMFLIGSRLLHYSERNKVILGVAFLLVPPVVLAAGDAALDTFVRGQEVSDLTSLSGRTDIWRVAISNQDDLDLFLGAGIGVASRRLTSTDVSFDKTAQVLGSAHNGFVEAHLGAGVIGSLPYQLLILGLLAAALQRVGRARSLTGLQVGASSVVIILTLRNLTGSILSSGSAELLLFAAAAAALSLSPAPELIPSEPPGNSVRQRVTGRRRG